MNMSAKTTAANAAVMGLGNTRRIVIGDTLHDINCGRSIGARCVAVATGHSSMKELATGRPDVLLNSLSQYAPILALLDNGSAPPNCR